MRYLRYALLGLVALAALLVGPAPVAQAATFTVDSTGDATDANPGNGACATAGAVCTLRAAIQEANALAGTDTINFSIAGAGPHTISPGSALPTITQPVIVDGTSEPDFVSTPVIELDGASAGAGVHGLTINAGSSTVKGLVINGFSQSGIKLSAIGSNLIQGNFIGTDINGTADSGNSVYGVWISDSPANTIGGTAAGERNVISGNDSVGVRISGSFATGNTVEGNYIGTDIAGTADLGNSSDGVSIGNAPSNTIGGTAAGEGNVISGNNSDGVDINGSGATGNAVEGNFIGTNATGTLDLGNSSSGVQINAASSNTIGGTAAGAGNVISGNNAAGIRIRGSGATGNKVEGNFVGTDVAGTTDLGNSTDGVSIENVPSNIIGGTAAGARNVISGNNRFGVYISGTEATGNKVEGNLIGTDVNGTTGLGNSLDGVQISNSASGNTIGGTAAAARNVISGNGQIGVFIQTSGATGNDVQGNYIGTDVNGTADLGNSSDGVLVNGAPSNTIGGTVAGAGNVISGNGRFGAFIVGGDATGNKVEGNYIGTQADGTSALGNASHGVRISSSASDNIVGGAAAGTGNTIAFNGGDGVFVESGTGNAIDPNSIHANTGLGIDLGTDGVTANDADDPDTGANNQQNFPVLTSAQSGGSTTTIQGTLDSTASTTFDLELFSNTSCDPSGFGEGETFLDSTTVVTDVNGDASFTLLAGTAVPLGQFITATATDPSDNTSEFSECEQVQARLFTVNSTGDAGDASAGDGTCATAGAVCTLRAVIEEANALGGTETIEFDIPGAGPHTISPGSALPTITDPVIIDGTSEPDFAGTPIVELDGTSAGTDGLNITSGSSVVKGLVINNFSGDGIELSTNGGNTIEGNYIGTDVTGTADLGNTFYGVSISDVPGNTIGGTAAGAGNVISGSHLVGVFISYSGATGNQVQGNYIGTDVTGTADLGNRAHGVQIYRAPSNTIGGTAAGAGNVISGNDSAGVYINVSGATGNQVQGNYIGTDVTGTIDLGNTSVGVMINDVPSNSIGGMAAGARNVISGNNGQGVQIAGSGATGNTVEGNYIGTQADGASALGNTSHGVGFYNGASNNTIGGTASGAANTIAYNNVDGVRVDGASGTGNTIRGNSIHSNTGLGIENTSGGNTELTPPVITAISSASGTACANCSIDVYSDDADEGRVYEGSTAADGAGNWSLSGSLTGPNVTATATDASGNTSEFATPLPDNDGDGVVNTSDNCPFVANGAAEAATPGVGNQTNTDDDLGTAGATIGGVPIGDSLGDACDSDDDDDGYSDVIEVGIGTTAVDNCTNSSSAGPGPNTDAFPSDMNKDDVVAINDVTGPFAPHFSAIEGVDPTGTNPGDYNPRVDLNQDGFIAINDITGPFAPDFAKSCT